MKKYLLILTLGLSMMFVTSCRWIHETFYSVEDCAEWYCEELYDAAIDEDKEDFCDRADQLEVWLKDLSESEQEKAIEAIEKWGDRHERKAEIIDSYAEEIF